MISRIIIAFVLVQNPSISAAPANAEEDSANAISMPTGPAAGDRLDHAPKTNPITDTEDKADAGQDAIDEIIVTASRREEYLRDVGVALSTIDPEYFTSAGLDQLKDAIEYTPGVDIIAGDNFGAGTIIMRAVTQEEYTPVTVVYVDDVPLTASTPYSFAAESFTDAMLVDIERIEVIKGPQGTLYGANAMGGVIRYVTRDPSMSEFKGNFTAGIAAVSHGGNKYHYRAMLSGPIVKDTLSASVTAYYSDRPGYMDRVDSTNTILARDVNDYQVNGLSVTGLWKPSSKATVKINATEFESPYEYLVTGVNYDWETLSPEYGRYRTDEGAWPGTSRFDNYSLTVKYEWPWAELTSVSARASHREQFIVDLTSQLGWVADEESNSPPGTNTLPSPRAASSRKLVQELRLTSPSDENFEWLAGVFFTDIDTTNVQSGIAEPSGFVVFDVSFPSEYRENAVFGDLTWYLNDQFDVTLGARFSDYRLSLKNYLQGWLLGLNPGEVQDLADSTKDRIWTYLLGARWHASRDASLYARAASGFRPASVNFPSADPETGESVAGPTVEGDDLWSYEVGIRGGLASGRVSYDIALWHIDWDNFQAGLVVDGVSVSGNTTSGITANGFEAMLSARPADGIDMVAAVAFADSWLKDDEPGIGALKGEPSKMLPRWTGSIRASYSFQFKGLDAQVGAGARYVGSYNTAYKSGEPGCGCAINFPVESYVLVDLNAEIQKERLIARFYVTNATDRYALSSATAYDSFGSVFARGTPVQPRTIGTTLTLSF